MSLRSQENVYSCCFTVSLGTRPLSPPLGATRPFIHFARAGLLHSYSPITGKEPRHPRPRSPAAWSQEPPPAPSGKARSSAGSQGAWPSEQESLRAEEPK